MLNKTPRPTALAGAFLLGAALTAALPDGAAAQDKSMTIKLATASVNDAQHEWMKRFAAAIEKNTSGRIKAEIYPASQLGTIPRMIEMTQLGSIQFWFGPPEFLVGIDQRFELLSAPGVFQNDQQALKTITDPEFSKAFLAIGAGKGLVGTGLLVSDRRPSRCGLRSAPPRTSKARKSACWRRRSRPTRSRGSAAPESR
jgi:TRAP-type C4-dicarboxylate transport system substrate-binding protein